MDEAWSQYRVSQQVAAAPDEIDVTPELGDFRVAYELNESRMRQVASTGLLAGHSSSALLLRPNPQG